MSKHLRIANMESLMKEFGIPQKEVHCVYVYFVNGVPHKKFGISQEVHFMHGKLVDQWNPSEGHGILH